MRTLLSVGALLGALLAIAPSAAASGPSSGLFVDIEGDLYHQDAGTAAVTLAGPSGLASYAADDLIYHPPSDTFYAVGQTSGAARMYAIDGSTFVGTDLGLLTEGASTFSAAEGLSYNPVDGLLYVTYGAGASSRLGTLVPGSTSVTFLTTVSGSSQGEADSLQWVGSTLYAVDVEAPRGTFHSNLYKLDTGSGVMTFVGTIVVGSNVNDMAYDPATGTLYGSDTATRELTIIDQGTGAGSPVGSQSTGSNVGLAFVPTPGTVPIPELGAIAFASTGLVALMVVATMRRR